MLRHLRPQLTLFTTCLTLLLIFVALNSAMIVRASHSMDVIEVQTCLNGAIFDGSPSVSSSLGIEMFGGVYDFDGNVIGHDPISHTFSEVGETYRFTVPYPADTFFVGDFITLSVSDTLEGSLGSEGSAIDIEVQDCQISGGGDTDTGNISNDLNIPNTSLNIDQVFRGNLGAEFGSVYVCADDRVNCQPWAPVIAYCDAGDILIYEANTDEGALPILVVTETIIDGVGAPEFATYLGEGFGFEGAVTLNLLPSGELEMIATSYTDKTYTFTWSGCHSN